jgi:hypothetical protein
MQQHIIAIPFDTFLIKVSKGTKRHYHQIFYPISFKIKFGKENKILFSSIQSIFDINNDNVGDLDGSMVQNQKSYLLVL